jgi:beta-lactamase class A
MITRRHFAAGGLAGLFGLAVAGRPRSAAAVPNARTGILAEAFARIEAESGGRLGAAVLDTASGLLVGHRADERFPFCSTIKALIAANVLARVEAGEDHLDRRIAVTQADILAYSPFVKERVGRGMTLAELCEAAIIVSDNAAANLLLGQLDGPSGVTGYLRSIGDTVTRLDRPEPELNEATPGDPRDTTSPAAMLTTLQSLLLGSALSDAGKQQLTAWLIANRTGGARLRAGFPQGWRVGDKTGTGERGTSNDVAIVWPPGRAPLLVAAYLTDSKAAGPARDATIAAVARAVAAAI